MKNIDYITNIRHIIAVERIHIDELVYVDISDCQKTLAVHSQGIVTSALF